nr:uncharacterized protein LOC126534534 [Dermacentor andersoni]
MQGPQSKTEAVGLLPPCQENAYLLTCIDRFTRWTEAIPAADITADTVARAFLHYWVARFGAPHIITTDPGRRFESSLFASIMHFICASRIRTTVYHQIHNRMVERFHRQLKPALAATEERHWIEALPFILLGIRTAVKTDIDCSVAELVYGTTLRLPEEFFTGSPEDGSTATAAYALRLRDIRENLRTTPPRWAAPRTVYASSELASCTHVFVRHDAVHEPLQPPYNGPFRGLRRGEKQFTITVRGRHEVVSLDRLKPTHFEEADTVSHAPSSLTPPSKGPLVQTRQVTRTRRGRVSRAPHHMDLRTI